MLIVRMGPTDHEDLPAGADCAVDAERARTLVEAGLATVVGGDAAAFEAHPDLVPAPVEPA